MFLRCQKISTTQSTAISTPRKKGFRKTLPSLERPVHVVAEWELNPKLQTEEEDVEATKQTIAVIYTKNIIAVNRKWD